MPFERAAAGPGTGPQALLEKIFLFQKMFKNIQVFQNIPNLLKFSTEIPNILTLGHVK